MNVVQRRVMSQPAATAMRNVLRTRPLTAQQSEILINDSDVDLGWLKPYFVRREGKTDAFPVSPVLPESSTRCSMNWNGYVATMRLHSDYRLELEHFDFPFAANSPSQACNVYFDGDFSITFRPFFSGLNTTVPFRDGRIVPNRNEWQIDDQTMDGVVSSVIRKRDTNKPIGLHVDIWGLAFAPRSLVPEQFRDDLDSIVGRSVRCTIAQIDDERGNVIIQIEEVGDD